MRIALCAAGQSPHTKRWANAVVDRGHEVALIWLREELEGADLTEYRASVDHHAYDPVSPRGRPWMIPVAALEPRRLARRLRPDLVHGISLSGHGWGAHAFRVRPLVLTALGSDVSDLDRRTGGTMPGRLADAYGVWRTRAAVAAADLVLADSTALADTVRKRVPGTRTEIVRFGVELDGPPSTARADWRQRLGIGDDAFVLLSSRLVNPKYNIDTIVTALATVREALPNAVLILKELPSLSDPAYRRRCLELADQLGVRNAMRLVGDLERGELLELHAAADVYLSVPNTDGTAVSVLEAMAAGVAVIATKAPGIDPVILEHEQTALLVPVRDPESLAAAAVRLAADAEERQRIAYRGREVVREHGDWERELDRAVLLYAELVADHRRGLRRGETDV